MITKSKKKRKSMFVGSKTTLMRGYLSKEEGECRLPCLCSVVTRWKKEKTHMCMSTMKMSWFCTVFWNFLSLCDGVTKKFSKYRTICWFFYVNNQWHQSSLNIIKQEGNNFLFSFRTVDDAWRKRKVFFGSIMKDESMQKKTQTKWKKKRIEFYFISSQRWMITSFLSFQ